MGLPPASPGGDIDGFQRAKREVIAAAAAAGERVGDGMMHISEVELIGSQPDSGGGVGGDDGGRCHGGRKSDSEQTLSGHTSPPSRTVRSLIACDSESASGRGSGDISSRCDLLDCGSETGSGSGSCKRSRGSGSGSGEGAGGEGGGGRLGVGSGGSGGTGGHHSNAGVLCSLSPLALPPPPPLLPYGDSHSLVEGAVRLGGDTSGLRDLLHTSPEQLSAMGIGSPLDLGLAAAGGMGGIGDMGGTLGGVGCLVPTGNLTGMSSMGGMGGMGIMSGIGSLGGMGLGIADLGGMGGLGGMTVSMGMALGLSADMGLPKGFSPTYSTVIPSSGRSTCVQVAGGTDGSMGLGSLPGDAAIAMDLGEDSPPAASPHSPDAMGAEAAHLRAGVATADEKESAAGRPAGNIRDDRGGGGGNGGIGQESLVVGATTSGAMDTADAAAKDAKACPKGTNPRQRRDAAAAKATPSTRRAENRLGEGRKLPPQKAEYQCTFEGCSKTFARRYNRVVHSRK